MKFLVQKISGKVVHDFAFELTRAQEYYDWLLGEEKLEIDWADDYVPDNIDPDMYIPVGSVEFVSSYLQKYYPESISSLIPLNVPECLFSEAGRKIINIRRPEDLKNHNEGQKLYLKSLTQIKDKRNGEIEYYNGISLIGYQVSEIIDIVSEWRVFVFHSEVQWLSNYSGDCLIFPDPTSIQRMVNIYSPESPVAYTLDIGINRGGRTFVIECHRFFSCGLYGYDDHKRIPKMLSQCWNQMKLCH